MKQQKSKSSYRKGGFKRASYRKEVRIPNNYVLGIYGRLLPIGHCKWYCDLHKCYLQGKDLKERNCMSKRCNHLKKLGKFKEIEE